MDLSCKKAESPKDESTHEEKPMKKKAKTLPLVTLLDSRDCSVELTILHDVATMMFCNARSASNIDEKVLNETVGVLLWHTIIFDKDTLKKFKNLRTIVCIGSAVDKIDLRAAGELGIAVCNVPEVGIEEVADSTLSLILSLYRRTYWLINTVSLGVNVNRPEHLAKAAEGCARIRDSTLGIVGMGRIGIAVALRAKPFGFNVIFYDPFLPDAMQYTLGFTRVNTLHELLMQSHCVSLHCTLSEYNHHLINEETIKQMRYGTFLVNTASSGLIDEEALATALEQGHIGAAAIDVHDNEPNHVAVGPLRNAPNLICTPHSAFYSEASAQETRFKAAIEFRRALTGTIPYCLRNCVNREYLRVQDGYPTVPLAGSSEDYYISTLLLENIPLFAPKPLPNTEQAHSTRQSSAAKISQPLTPNSVVQRSQLSTPQASPTSVPTQQLPMTTPHTVAQILQPPRRSRPHLSSELLTNC